MSEHETPRFAIFATLIATVIILAMIVASIAAGSVRQPPRAGGDLPDYVTTFTYEGHTCVYTQGAMQCWETP